MSFVISFEKHLSVDGHNKWLKGICWFYFCNESTVHGHELFKVTKMFHLR